jgi:hypothetical protein
VPKRKKLPLQYDLLTQREQERTRAQLRDHSNRRVEDLKRILRGHVDPRPAFEITETRHHADDGPQMSVNEAGEARGTGFLLVESPQYRLHIQETLRFMGGMPPFFVAHYTYIFVDANTEEPLFRFEYDPHGKGAHNQWSRSHHFHVVGMNQDVPRVHFAIAPFYDDPQANPHKVLSRLLDWSYDELT